MIRCWWKYCFVFAGGEGWEWVARRPCSGTCARSARRMAAEERTCPQPATAPASDSWRRRRRAMTATVGRRPLLPAAALSLVVLLLVTSAPALAKRNNHHNGGANQNNNNHLTNGGNGNSPTAAPNHQNQQLPQQQPPQQSISFESAGSEFLKGKSELNARYLRNFMKNGHYMQ